MKRILLLLTFIFSFFIAKSQEITGKITDENRNPIEFANVILLKTSDSTFMAGVVSDSLGNFKIKTPERNYFLQVSAMGYKTFRQDVNQNNLRTITLQQDATVLQEAQVTALRPRITVTGTGIEVNIENSILATGNTIESLFRQLPGVWINNGNISINGKSGVLVMINEREVNFSGEQLANYLNSLRSEDVSKIEIISNPSSVYSAANLGGIIKIITKNRIDEGWSAMLSNNLTVLAYNGVQPYASFQYNRGKFMNSFSVNGNFGRGTGLFTNSDEKDLLSGVSYISHSEDKMRDKNYSFNTDLFYKINDRNNIAFNAGYLLWSKNEDIAGNTNVNDSNSAVILSDDNRNDIQKQQVYWFALNYNLLLNSDGSDKLMLMTNFDNQFSYTTDNNNEFSNYDNQHQIIYQNSFLNKQNNPYRIFATDLRYINDLGKAGNITTGLKYSISNIYNDLSYFDKLNNAWQLNDTIGYNFHYNEQLYAFYAQYYINREKWDLTAGLRAEGTTGKVIDITETDKRFDFFPSVFFNYFLTESQTLGISYSRRIQRISYFRLMPRRWYSSQYSIMEGNPDLKPNIHNNLELNYNISNKYSFSLGYYWNNNAMSSYNRSQIIDNKTVFVSTYKDGIKNKNFNFNAYIPITFTKWWSSTNQLYGNYNEYKSADFYYKNFSYGFFTQHTFLMFWKLKSEILYRFYSPEKSAYSEDDPYHLLGFSVQRNFLSDKLTVKLALDRILCYQKPATKTVTPTVESITKMYGKSIPYLSFTITYSFSKGKTEQMQNITNANDQEKNRTY